MENSPIQMITWEALLTATGVATVTVILTNVLRDRAGIKAHWLALVIAPVLSVVARLAVSAAAGTNVTASEIGIAILTGLIAVYSMSVTGNELIASRKAVRTIGGSGGFFRSWF